MCYLGKSLFASLEKTPETKHELGIALVSGWDILNVAQAVVGANRTHYDD